MTRRTDVWMIAAIAAIAAGNAIGTIVVVWWVVGWHQW